MELSKLSWQYQSFSSIEITLFLSTLFVSLLFFIHNGKKNKNKQAKPRLKLPPSPPRFPVIGNLHQLGRFPHRSLRDLSEKHGPVLLLYLGQVPTLLISSPEAVKEIAKEHDKEFSDRPITTAVQILLYGGKDMAFSPYGEYWRQTRRICALELLSLRRVQSFRSVREEETVRLVERLRRESLGGTAVVNLSELLISTAQNTVTRCIIGQKYDLEGVGTGSEVLENLARRLMVQFLAFSVGDFFPSLRWIDVLRGFISSLKSTSRALDSFYSQVFEEHKAAELLRTSTSSTTAKNFAEILIQLQKDRSLTGFELTDNHIKAILQDMLMGGIETTSTVTEWLMSELLRNPRVMKKVQEEVRRVVGKGKAKVDISDIERMDYFQCVVRENFRLHLPAPLFLPRKTSKSVRVGGYDIPENTNVIVNGWAIHRHPNSWVNPDEFIPERFEDNKVDFRNRDCFELIPFGFGRRQCPGMTFGIFSTEYLVANLLYLFDWKLPEGDNTVDMSEVFGVTVHKKLPLRAVPIYMG